MYKWIMSAIVTVACAFGVYLLASGLPEKPHEEVLPEGQELLKITASNFEFDQKEYHVKAGTKYRIKFSNSLGKHGAAIKDLGIDLNENNPTQEVTFDKPGTYELHCSIMCGQGHAGMKATIIVS
ncbi:cytochrome c oxidase subunit II [Cohnella sp. CFH 77786]|uniref:cupredoxin domain-containing protein n=1 Tax=Cohnella sp. CFH 77786 TaxID=2662265 RepID=UPI001C60B386|nr:cupredoxin domain-containing protein [Cohnella sp. CFH 77786]MBW5445040.1 cytochrome c oxidase subunit II [Cohnella sp. CFH 77786]